MQAQAAGTALLPDESLRRLVWSGGSLLQQILEFPKIQSGIKSQAKKAQETLELLIPETELQALQQPVQVPRADQAVPVGVGLKEDGVGVLETKRSVTARPLTARATHARPARTTPCRHAWGPVCRVTGAGLDFTPRGHQGPALFWGPEDSAQVPVLCGS